ncbi:MAG: hypothetical protein K8S98_14860 [Planctomycetes bacterium]|nr:hypothetical protein [Planctomycetota bacterium]
MFVLSAVLAYVAIARFPIEPVDRTDEHEWTAISIAHFGQLFAGRTPPGAQSGESEWRAGVQGTTFGATNPCFAKLLFGAALWSTGHRSARPEVFQRFALADPAAASAARAELEPALPVARNVVRVCAALCAGMVAVIALELGGSLAALLASSFFALSPLVRTWGGFVRTDFVMLAMALAVLAAALVWREVLAGERGLARRLLAAAALGALAGLATAAKFNGAPSAFVAGAAIAFALVGAKHGRKPGALRDLALALCTAAFAWTALVWLLDPVLWRHPFDELRAILAFWDEHMRYQQERAAAHGVATADGPLASLRFAAQRLVTRDEPLVAWTGVAGGWLLVVAGLGVLALRAWRNRSCGFAARVVLAHVVLFGGITAAWIPLDWDRYFLPLVALYALLEALALSAAFETCRGFIGRRRASE